jgi:hypothetical protein
MSIDTSVSVILSEDETLRAETCLSYVKCSKSGYLIIYECVCWCVFEMAI